jgi:diguanylate cyclase (GGDEF)-like protein
MSPAPRPSLDAGLVRHTGRSYWQALTRAAEAAAAVHVAFSVLFFALGAPVLGAANVGSVVVYALIRSLLLRRRNRTALVLLWLELLLHALVATRVLGWDSGFHYYLLLMMPLVFVSPTRTLRSKLLLGSALAAFYIGLDAYAHQRAPLSEIAPGALHALRYFNIATTMALLAYLAHAYFGAVMRAERRLHDLATTDALTGLANRRRMLQAADQHLGRRRSDGTPLSFILGDVDHFKSVNDRHGHDVGDRVLVKVARAMKQATREADLVGRWGGEEFLIVLPETGLDEALHVAERVREAVRQGAAGHDGQDLHVTITLGVSSLREGESLASAISRADAAMYRGKLGGRNRSVAEEADVPAAEAAGRPLAAANG